MNERLIPFAMFQLDAQADADGIEPQYVPKSMLFTHISHGLTMTGTPTASTIDIQDDCSDISGAVAVDVSSAALATLTTPKRIEAGSMVELDLNLAGGTSPKATGRVILWGYVSE